MLFVLFFVMLFHSVTAEDCPHGWVFHDASCYLLSHDRQQWTQAAMLCTAFGGKLAEIETPEENSFLTKLINLYEESFWIGMSDVQAENVWMWMNSKETLANIGFNNWSPNQPDNRDKNENCGRILPNSTGWDDFRCTGALNYVCENLSGPYQNRKI